MSIQGASWVCGWWLPAPSDWRLRRCSGWSLRSGNTTIKSGMVRGSFLCIICPHRGLLGVVDGSCLLLEIGGSGVDQGEAGGF